MASSDLRLPPGFRTRPATRDDLPATDGLYRASELALGVLPEERSSYLRWRWSQPYVELARDTRVVHHGEDLVAFAMAHREEDDAVGPLIGMGRVAPSHLGRGLGSWILEWYGRTAADRAADAVRTGCPAEDEPAQSLFRAAGYDRVRTSFDMGVDLTGSEEPGQPLAGVTLRPFRPGRDEQVLWQTATEAFRDHWDHEGDQSFESFMAEWFGDPNDPAEVVLAEADGRVVGEVGWVRVPAGAYVHSVAVLAAYRRRGIGGALLHAAIVDAAAETLPHIYLSVDGANPTGAVGVYQRAGMSVLRTVHLFDKELA